MLSLASKEGEVVSVKYKIIATLFLPEEDYDGDGKCDRAVWELLKAGFKKSIADNTRGELKLIEVSAPARREGCRYIFSALLEKTKIWAEEVKKLRMNAVITDVDILFKHDVRKVFREDFDIAITRRPGDAWFNSGVMFVKPTAGARRLFDLWYAQTLKLYESETVNGVPGDVLAARKSTGQKHFNQPAFAQLLESGAFDGIKILELPAEVYNCCNRLWHTYTADTKIVHLNPKLRDAVLFDKVNRRNGRDWRKAITACKRYYLPFMDN